MTKSVSRRLNILCIVYKIISFFYEYRCVPDYMLLELGDNCIVFESIFFIEKVRKTGKVFIFPTGKISHIKLFKVCLKVI